MKLEKIDHICFAGKDLEETKRVYENDRVAAHPSIPQGERLLNDRQIISG